MATKPNIDKLYEKLFSIKEMLTEVIQTANEAANDANSFGGEIARVIPNQLRTMLVPALQQYIDSPSNPVAMDSVVRFLDSLPLSKVRVGRQDDAVPGGADAGAMPGAPMSPDAVGAAAAAGMPPPAPTGAMTGLEAGAAELPEEGMYESVHHIKEGTDVCPSCGSSNVTCDEDGVVECYACGGHRVGKYNWADGELEESSSRRTRESAILKAKGQELLDVMKERWEAEHQEQPLQEGVLDFSMIKEGYQRKPSTPEVFTRNNEEKVYQKVVESAQKKPSKLQEADMLVSPYVKQEVSDMSGWRDLVESHVLDSEINERLGAGAVAAALLSEGEEESTKAGLARMKELVSPQTPAADAGDVAALLMSGRISETDDSLSLDRVRESVQDDIGGGDDLAALVNSDMRELV